MQNAFAACVTPCAAIHAPTGTYQFTSYPMYPNGLQLNNLDIFGDGSNGTIFQPRGCPMSAGGLAPPAAVSFGNTGSVGALNGGGAHDLGMDASDMVCGYAYALEGDQKKPGIAGALHNHITLENIYVNNPYNFAYISQSDYAVLSRVQVDTLVRGDYCIRLYGLDTYNGTIGYDFRIIHPEMLNVKCASSYGDGLMWGSANAKSPACPTGICHGSIAFSIEGDMESLKTSDVGFQSFPWEFVVQDTYDPGPSATYNSVPGLMDIAGSTGLNNCWHPCGYITALSGGLVFHNLFSQYESLLSGTPPGGFDEDNFYVAHSYLAGSTLKAINDVSFLSGNIDGGARCGINFNGFGLSTDNLKFINNNNETNGGSLLTGTMNGTKTISLTSNPMTKGWQLGWTVTGSTIPPNDPIVAMSSSSVTVAIATGTATGTSVTAVAGGWADICVGPTPSTDTSNVTGNVNLNGRGCWNDPDNNRCPSEAEGVLIEDDSPRYTYWFTTPDTNPGSDCGLGIRINGGNWAPVAPSTVNPAYIAPYIDNCEANSPGNVTYSNYGAQLPRNSNITAPGNATLTVGTNWNIGSKFDLWVLNRTGPTSGTATDTFTDTATAILAELPGGAVGQCYRMQYNNFSGASITLAKTASSISFSPGSPAPILAGHVSFLRLCITNVTTPAITIYQD